MPLEVAAFVTPTIINRVTDCQFAMHNVANCAKVSKKKEFIIAFAILLLQIYSNVTTGAQAHARLQLKLMRWSDIERPANETEITEASFRCQRGNRPRACLRVDRS